MKHWTTNELDFGFWGLFEGDTLLSKEFHTEEEANKVCAAHNVAIEECSNALRRLIGVVNTHMLCGIPEIKTVDDVIRGMRSVADKLQSVASDKSLTNT